MSLLDKAGLQELWGKIKNLVSSTTYTKTAIDTKLNGKKSTQGAVSDPAASGTGVEFISGISQNAQGVISPSKKTVRTMGPASADAAGSTGLVPAPAQGDQGKFLNGAGQWQTPTHQTIKQNGVTGATANRYGTCTTDAGTAAKTVTITTGTFTLEAGATVYVKFTNSNTANLPTLNVNGTGAISIMRYGTTHAGTVAATSWTAGAVVPFTYDGTYWIMQSAWDNNNTYTNEVLGQGYGICTTEAATAAKVVALSSYALIKGGVVSVKFTNSVPASATMSINQKSAKAIFYKGAAITAGVIKAGDLATFIYDGTQYHLLSIDRWPDDSEIASTVDGKTNVEQVLSYHSQQIEDLADEDVNLSNAIAIVISGNVSPTGGITATKYYIWNGYLRHPTANIAAGETLTDSNMPIVPDGGLNDVSTIINYTSQCTSSVGEIKTGYSSAKCINNICFVSFTINIKSSVSGDGIILSLPSAMRSDSSIKYFKDSIENRSYYIQGAHIHTVGLLSSGDTCRFLIVYI